MGTNTTNLNLYKPAAHENGAAALVDANFDTIDTDLYAAKVATTPTGNLPSLSQPGDAGDPGSSTVMSPEDHLHPREAVPVEPYVAVAALDQAFQATTTLANDNTLALAVGDGASLYIEGDISYSCIAGSGTPPTGWASDFGRGSHSATSSGTTDATTVTADVAVGKVFVVFVGSNNIATVNGNSSNVTSVTDTQGNTYLKAAEYTYSPTGNTADGALAAVWYCQLTAGLTNAVDVVTVHYSAALTAKTMGLFSFTIDANATVGTPIHTGGFSANSTTGPNLTVQGLTSGVHYNVVATDTLEGPSTDTFTHATGYQNLQSANTGSGGAADTNIIFKGQCLTPVDNAGITTKSHVSTNSVARDWASVLVAFPEVPQVTGGDGGIKLGWAVPSGATMLWDFDTSFNADAPAKTASGTVSRSISADGDYIARVAGFFYNGSTAGNLQLKIAQQTAAGTTIRRSGSRLKGTLLNGAAAPGPPNVPIGPYSGTLAQLQAEEVVLGFQNLPTWYFGRLDSGLPTGYDTGRLVLFNIAPRIASGFVTWASIAAGTYDTSLHTTLASCAGMTQSTIYLSIFQEMDGVGINPFGESFATYQSAFTHIKTLAAAYCPNALVGQCLASSAHMTSFGVVTNADWVGFDPHIYGTGASQGKNWATSPAPETFAQRVADGVAAMASAGLTTAMPFTVHTGCVENGLNANSKSQYITDMFALLNVGKDTYPNFVFATWWDRTGTVNGFTADERIGTSTQAQTAFITGLGG